MKRKEQINKAALEYANKSIRDKGIAYLEFKEAVEWADRTLIEKACDWLQMNAMKYVNSIGGCMYFDVINSTKDFKKAMEE